MVRSVFDYLKSVKLVSRRRLKSEFVTYPFMLNHLIGL